MYVTIRSLCSSNSLWSILYKKCSFYVILFRTPPIFVTMITKTWNVTTLRLVHIMFLQTKFIISLKTSKIENILKYQFYSCCNSRHIGTWHLSPALQKSEWYANNSALVWAISSESHCSLWDAIQISPTKRFIYGQISRKWASEHCQLSSQLQTWVNNRFIFSGFSSKLFLK